MNQKKIQKRFAISSWAIGNPMTVFILILIILGWGLYSFLSLPRENFPEIVNDELFISTPFPGNAAEDVEKLITIPIEDEIKDVKGVVSVSSSSLNDYSMVVAQIEGVSLEQAKLDIKDKIDEVKATSDWPTLDSGPKVEPNVFQLNLAEEVPILNINLKGDFPVQKIKEYGEILQNRIEDLQEIKKVDIRGVEEKEVEVALDVYRMNAAKVSFQDVIGAISKENTTISSGALPLDGKDTNIRVKGQVESPEELGLLVVKRNGGVVYLKDISDIEFKSKDATTYAREYGEPVVMLEVKKRSGENMIQAVEKIRIILEEVQKDKFPQDLKVSVSNDQSEVTESQVTDLINNIIFGVILVVGVLLFFLGFRNASFVGFAIPLSMLMSLIIVSLLGYTLNTMILFALVMGLGMLVDNGIVVVENVYTLISEGVPPIEAAKQGVGEIAWPIIASTATTLAAFFPLGLWPGVMGKFMIYFPLTLSIVLSSSLFVALIINSMLTSRYMRANDENIKNKTLIRNTVIFTVSGIVFLVSGFLLKSGMLRGVGSALLLATVLIWVYKYLLFPSSKFFQEKVLPNLENKYKRLLTVILKWPNPIFLIIGMVVLFIFSIMLFSILPPKVLFFPENQPNQVMVYIEYSEGTDIDKTNATTKVVEKRFISALDKYVDGGYNYMVESVVTQVGEGATNINESAGSAAATPHKGKITASFRQFKLRNGTSSSDVMEEIRTAVSGVPGAKVSVEKDAAGPPRGFAVNLELSGENYELLLKESQKVLTFLQKAEVEGVEELKVNVDAEHPELFLEVDRARAGELGITNQMVGGTLRQSVYGWEASRYRPKNDKDDYEINVRLRKDQRENLSVVKNQNITFTNPNNGVIMSVPISAVTKDSLRKTYLKVNREDYKRVVTIYSNVLGDYNANEVVAKLKDKLDSYDFPEEVEYKFTGEQEEQAKNQNFLSFALMLGVLGILLIIILQFNSISRPLIILFTVLLSFIGVFIGLLLSGKEFVILMTMMGIISLAGIVVNNAIVLIDYTDFLIKSKKKQLNIPDDIFLPIKEIRSLIIEGGKSRLRPVLLTAITTILGLIPLAVGFNINFFTLLTDFDPQIYIGGDNVKFWGPLAWTVIYGLTFATFLTLVVVPALYYLSYLIKLKIFKNRQGVS